MGFALWTDAELAWAAGTSEYRAMGTAVVSRTDLFRAADFRPSRRLPPRLSFAGYFASLGQINACLVKARGTLIPSARADGRPTRPTGRRPARNPARRPG